jgi:phosphatidylglycerophosphate synthase/putative flippase GtrA
MMLLQGLGQSVNYWEPLTPAFVVAGYFIGGLVLYAIRYLLVGHWRDAEMESRGSTRLVGMWIRLYFAWVTRPLWRLIRWARIPATAITSLSVVLAVAAGFAVGSGHFALGGWLYISSGICDFLDGRVARATGTAGRAGAALDSVLDRYSDTAILIGLAWYYRSSWILLATLVAIVGTVLVPYVRARGEGLGAEVKVGLMQRPERVVYLGASVALSPILEGFVGVVDVRPTYHLAIVGILLIAVLSNLTAIQRLIHLLAKLLPAKTVESLGQDGKRIGRFTVAAAVATIIDFWVMFGLVEFLEIKPWWATAAGCFVGAGVNFAMNRFWTFGDRSSPIAQGARYSFVSTSSAFLNSGGVALLLLSPGIGYAAAWLLVRAMVFMGWNYPLQKHFVFNAEKDDAPAAERTDSPIGASV